MPRCRLGTPAPGLLGLFLDLRQHTGLSRAVLGVNGQQVCQASNIQVMGRRLQEWPEQQEEGKEVARSVKPGRQGLCLRGVKQARKAEGLPVRTV